MNKSNFLLALGLFWLVSSLMMLVTGYWEALRSFGVTESLFLALAYLSLAMGVGAIVYNRLIGRAGKHPGFSNEKVG